jgi:hypothetical protein
VSFTHRSFSHVYFTSRKINCVTLHEHPELPII